jgi:hypothetical protein
MATSTAQTVPLVALYDYYLAPGDPSTATTSKGKVGRQIKVTLQYDKAVTLSPDPVVWVAQEAIYSALTDANGFWQVNLVPNNKITPANTYYTVEIEGGPSYKVQLTDVGVPAAGWQSSAAGVLLDIPAALAGTTSTVGAITATGLITAQAGISITAGGLTVSGGETDTGGLTVDTITYSLAVSRLIPGGTSFSVRDTGNANDNLLVTNAGNITARGSLTVTGGPLTVSAGGMAVTGNSTVTGTLVVTSTLTVSAGGAAITGTSTVTGTLTVSGLVTAQAGLTVSSGTTTVAALTASGTVTVPDSSFTMRKLKTTSGTDRGSASGTWTSFATGGTTFVNLSAPPTVSLTPAVISTVFVFWTVSWATGGAAGSTNNWRSTLDGTSFGTTMEWVVPTSSPGGMTISGVDVYAGVSAAAHTIQLQVQTPAGSTTISAVGGGLSIAVLAIP